MKKTFLAFIIVFISGVSNAQGLFKNGDKYIRTISVKTNTVLQQGNRSIDINTSSSVNRGYSVDKIAANMYKFIITTNKIADTVKTAKEQIKYSSDNMVDAGSFIEKSLNEVKGKFISIVVGENGILVATSRIYPANKNDSLLAFSGLLPDQLIAGNTIDLIANVPPGYALTPGTKWTSIVTTIYGKQVLTYTVLSTGNGTSILSFKGTEERRYDNGQQAMPITCYFATNLSGKMKVDNKSLVIKERYTKTATSGYQSINRVVFAVAKRSSIAEITVAN